MKTIFMREKDILPICKGQKTKTMRKITDFPKFKEGDFIDLKANHSKPPFASVKITAIYPIMDVSKMFADFFKPFGYRTKKEYLNEDFNKKHISNARTVIEFEIVYLGLNGYFAEYLGW